MRTIKLIAILVFVCLVLLGARQIPGILRETGNQIVEELDEAYTKVFIREVIKKEVIVQEVEKERDWGDGISGLAAKYATQEGVPPSIMLSVIETESSNDVSNRSFAIAPKYQEGGRSYKPGPERWRYAAYGLCGLTPAYTMELCDYEAPEEIWGPDPDVIDKHLRCCAKRLKQDFDLSRAKAGESTTGYAQWDRALVRFYGARADGYQTRVLAKAVNKMFNNAG